MKTILITILASVLVITCSLTGCKKNGCGGKSGSTTRGVRTVPYFTDIVLNDNINLVLKQDSVTKVEIETDENIQGSISAEVVNKQLVLKNNASCSWIKQPGEKVTAYVSVVVLNNLNYQGSGDITNVDTLRFGYFFLEADGAAGNVFLRMKNNFTQAQIDNEVADLVFEGSSDTCYAYSGSRGTIDFRNFAVRAMDINYVGLRDAYVNATQNLHATIHYKGNVYYKGSPSFIAPVYKSTGKLIPF